jgi:hypothetical protein
MASTLPAAKQDVSAGRRCATTYRRLLAQAQRADAALLVATEKQFGCI